jgi:hypothetical protein
MRLNSPNRFTRKNSTIMPQNRLDSTRPAGELFSQFKSTRNPPHHRHHRRRRSQSNPQRHHPHHAMSTRRPRSRTNAKRRRRRGDEEEEEDATTVDESTSTRTAATSQPTVDATTRDVDSTMGDDHTTSITGAFGRATPTSTVHAKDAPLDTTTDDRPPMHSTKRPRHTAQRASHIDALATVEVQLMMQMLDRVSLLAVARSSRRLRSIADSDIAWKYQPPHEIKFGPAEIDVGDRIRQSILRHAPTMSVDWRLDEESESFYPTDDEVNALLHIPRMSRLRVSAFVTPSQYRQVLTHPALASLSELIFESEAELPIGFIDLLIHMASLTNLEIGRTLPIGDRLTALPQLKKLKKLALCDSSEDTSEASRTDVIAQCTQLTDLTMFSPGINGPHFRAFFTSNLGHQLERLTLNQFDARGSASHREVIPAEDYIAAFQSLLQLRFLCLTDVNDVDDLIRHLHHAPALEMLEVGSLAVWPSTAWPSAAALSQLLQRTPVATLHTVIVPGMPEFLGFALAQRYASLKFSRFTCRTK